MKKKERKKIQHQIRLSAVTIWMLSYGDTLSGDSAGGDRAPGPRLVLRIRPVKFRIFVAMLSLMLRPRRWSTDIRRVSRTGGVPAAAAAAAAAVVVDVGSVVNGRGRSLPTCAFSSITMLIVSVSFSDSLDSGAGAGGGGGGVVRC